MSPSAPYSSSFEIHPRSFQFRLSRGSGIQRPQSSDNRSWQAVLGGHPFPSELHSSLPQLLSTMGSTFSSSSGGQQVPPSQSIPNGQLSLLEHGIPKAAVTTTSATPRRFGVPPAADADASVVWWLPVPAAAAVAMRAVNRAMEIFIMLWQWLFDWSECGIIMRCWYDSKESSQR